MEINFVMLAEQLSLVYAVGMVSLLSICIQNLPIASVKRAVISGICCGMVSLLS